MCVHAVDSVLNYMHMCSSYQFEHFFCESSCTSITRNNKFASDAVFIVFVCFVVLLIIVNMFYFLQKWMVYVNYY